MIFLPYQRLISITMIPFVLTQSDLSAIHHHGHPVEMVMDTTISERSDELLNGEVMYQADWFQEVWNERRRLFAQRESTDRGAVVFLGDSIIQHWGDTLGGSFGDLKVANRGISGDTTRGMVMRLERDVLLLNPRAVVLLMGTNDIEKGISSKMIARNVELIIEALHKHNPKMAIILCAVMPSSSLMNRPTWTIRELNQRLAKAAKGHGEVIFIDTWTLFANHRGDAKVEEFPDLLHPNEKGYAKWAAALRPILIQLKLQHGGE